MLHSWRSTAKQAETVFVTCDLIEISESMYMPRSRTTEVGITSSVPTRSTWWVRQLMRTSTGTRPQDLGLWCVQLMVDWIQLLSGKNVKVFTTYWNSLAVRCYKTSCLCSTYNIGGNKCVKWSQPKVLRNTRWLAVVTSKLQLPYLVSSSQCTHAVIFGPHTGIVPVLLPWCLKTGIKQQLHCVVMKTIPDIACLPWDSVMWF